MSERVDEIRERCDRLAVDIYDKVGRCYICNMGHDYGHEIDCPANLHHDVRDLLDRLEGEVVGRRVETGPLKVGNDWPGLFIRGDTAGYFALALRSVLNRVEKSDNFGEQSSVLTCEQLAEHLESCNVVTDPAVQYIYRRTHQTPEEG